MCVNTLVERERERERTEYIDTFPLRKISVFLGGGSASELLRDDVVSE